MAARSMPRRLSASLTLTALVLFETWCHTPADSASCSSDSGKAACKDIAPSAGCGAAKVCSVLGHGQWLAAGEWLTSPSGNFVAVLEKDQFKLHQASVPNSEPLWSAPDPAAGSLAAAHLVEGYLLLEAESGQHLWSSTVSRNFFIRFTVKSTRGGGGMQVAELIFFENGQQLPADTWSFVSSTGNGPGSEGPRNAVDGNPASKWFTFTDPATEGIELLLRSTRSVNLDQFRFLTANDVPDRDPITWKLEGSADGINWVEMHSQATAYATPSARGAATHRLPLSKQWRDWSASRKELSAVDFEKATLSLSDSGILSVTADNESLWAVSGVAKQPEEAPAADPEVEHKQKMATCNQRLSCQPCIDSGCAWCLGMRRCVVDKAWVCQGQEDHVSPPGGNIGEASCPDQAKIQEDHQKRRERAAAAQILPPEQETGESSGSGAAQAAKEKKSEEEEESRDDPDEKIDPDLLVELKWRARFADEEQGAKPYRVLKLKNDASASAIRKAYRRLSLKFHPDKWARNKREWKQYAEKAFADLTKAYDTIGSPDKRAAFDDGLNFEESKGSGDESFYYGDPLIASLTEELWEKRLTGTSIWLIEFYAAWCPRCRQTTHIWKEIAKRVEHLPVEVGAVNCVKHRKICSEYVSVGSYPSVRLLNRGFGTMQNHKGDIADVDGIVSWVEKVAKEWKWLFSNSEIHWDLSDSSFAPNGTVADSEDMWLVAFMDGFECAACKATSTNLLRLSASLRGLPVKIGTVDCSLPNLRTFCYEEHGVPQPPHRPLVKAWRSGPKNTSSLSEPGEVLYGPADVEPHIAFMIIEKVVRLALADRQGQQGLTEHQRAGDYDEEEKPDEDEPPPSPSGGGWQSQPDLPELLWDDSGISDRRALPKPWQTFDGQFRQRNPQLGR